MAAINTFAGLFGMVTPFGILGEYVPFYSDLLGTDETELLTVHLARMCQTLSFAFGLLFWVLRSESMRVKGSLLAINSLATLWFSVGEIYLDGPRARRLGIDWEDNTKVEAYPRSIRFLVGCLDGGSFGALCLAALGVLVAIAALVAVANNDQKEPQNDRQQRKAK